MQVKCRAIKASKVSVENATAQLQSHLKYLQYRQHTPDHVQRNECSFFHQRAHSVSRCWVQHDLMPRQGGTIYYYQLFFMPAYNEPVAHYRRWTCALLHDFARWLGLELNWYAIEHHTIDYSHIHVVLHGIGNDRETGCARQVRLRAQDLTYLEKQGRTHSEYMLEHILAETLQELDQSDLMSDETFL